MKEFTYTITDPVGIHARPAGQLVKAVKAQSSQITLVKGANETDASRLISVMGLGVKKGETVLVRVSGENEALDFETIKMFFEENL